jgi:cytochrome P450
VSEIRPRYANARAEGIPGKRWPAFIQTALWVFRPVPFLFKLNREFGDTFRVRLMSVGDIVLTTDPEEIRKVFTAKADRLHAGEANIVLAPIVGDNSVLVLDDEPHMRQRKLLLPPFHGDRMRAYLEAMEEITNESIDSWPRGTAFPLREETQAITMDVILRVVFGITEPARRREFRDRMIAIDPQRWFKKFALMPIATKIPTLGERVFREFNKNKQAFDDLMIEEIHNRRDAPDALEREDILSMLLQAHDEDGKPMTDDELRDELVTLVVAGHETTATALAWTFELMLREPEVWKRVVDEANSEDSGFDYVDAVVKESLRMRPILPAVGRVIKEPIEVAGEMLPRNAVISPNIFLSHYRKETWGDPENFRPERFLGESPSAYSWFPFGGGIRRCIGASFALYEMRAVIQTIARRVDMRLERDVPERIVRRAITFAPGKDVPVIVRDAAPRADAQTEQREPASAI